MKLYEIYLRQITHLRQQQLQYQQFSMYKNTKNVIHFQVKMERRHNSREHSTRIYFDHKIYILCISRHRNVTEPFVKEKLNLLIFPIHNNCNIVSTAYPKLL